MLLDECIREAEKEVINSDCDLLIVKDNLSETPDAPYGYCAPAYLPYLFRDYEIVPTVLKRELTNKL